MDHTADQTTYNELFIPDTIYTTGDIQDGVLPSQYDAVGLGDLALFPELIGMPPSLEYVPWELEELGYRYVAPAVHADGTMDGGVHTPEYYAYSPRRVYSPRRIDRWEDSSQALDDDDNGWSELEQDGDRTGVGHLGDPGAADGLGVGGVENTGEPRLEFNIGHFVQTDEEPADFTLDIVGGTSTMSIGLQPLKPFASRVHGFTFMDHAFNTMATQDNSVPNKSQYTTGPFQQAMPEFHLGMAEVIEPGWSNDAAMAFDDARVESTASPNPQGQSQPPMEPLQSLFTAFENSEKGSAFHHRTQAIEDLQPVQQQSSSVASFPMQQQFIFGPPLTMIDPAHPTATHEESREELDHREWEAKLQEAAARQASIGLPGLPALSYGGASSAASEYQTAQVREPEGVMSLAVDTIQGSNDDELDDSQDIHLVDAEAMEPEDIAEGAGEDVEWPPMDAHFDVDDVGAENADADKQTPTMEALSVPAHVDVETADKTSTPPKATFRPKRRTATKSYKETSDAIESEEENVTATQKPKELVGYLAFDINCHS
jgi:hypothetical protein